MKQILAFAASLLFVQFISVGVVSGQEDASSDNQTETDAQIYNAGSLLSKGQFDITMFNSLYTETRTNWLGADITGFRTSFVTSLWQFTYGVSKNARVNVGLDISFRASATGSSNKVSELARPFEFRNNDSTRYGIAYIAPRVKVSPFRGIDDFSIQSTFIVSFAKNPEGFTNPDGTGNGNLYWLEWNRYIWWNQFFYTYLFGKDRFQLFAEADLLFRFARFKTQSSMVDLPVSAFLSWFPHKKWTVYAMTQFVPRFVYSTGSPENTDWVVGATYTQSGGGIKYQITPQFNMELLYTNFWQAVNNGQGSTFNLGLRYVSRR